MRALLLLLLLAPAANALTVKKGSPTFFVSVSSLTAHDAGLAATTEEILFWVGADTDTASGFSAASSQTITATQTGVYNVSCQVSIGNAGTDLAVWVYLNGAKAITGNCDPTTASAESTCLANKVLSLKANDTLYCSAYSQTATNIRTRNDLSFFQAARIQ